MFLTGVSLRGHVRHRRLAQDPAMLIGSRAIQGLAPR